MATLLLAVIYLAYISLGLPDSLLGSGWVVMHSYFSVSIASAGIVSMITSFFTIVSSLLSERLTKKFSTKYVTMFSVFLTAIALFGFSISTKFYMLCLFAVPYGLGAGSIDAALNNYVALHYSSRHMSWLHCFWGVGTIISPYIMSYSIASYDWQTGYRAISILQLVIAFIIVFTLPFWKAHKSSNPLQNKEEKVVGIIGALKIKGVPHLLIGFFCYCAQEALWMLWSATYLQHTKNISEETSAALASLFFIGITVGRFISGFFANKVGDKNMIRIGTAITAIGIIITAIYSLPDYITYAGFVIIGLGCAPIYPCIIHLTPYNFGEENSQSIIGIQMASAYIGTTFIPPLFGFISNQTSLLLLPYFAMIFVVVMIFMLGLTYRKTKI